MEVFHEGRSCTPTAPKARWVLALLVVRANQVVGIDSIIEELWGENPPRSAVATAQTYVYHLRRKVMRDGPADSGPLLETRPPGYLLRVPREAVDALVFERLAEEGRALLEDGQPREAAARLRQALGVWRGPVLADVPAGPLLSAHIPRLNEQRLRSRELLIQADLQLGRHRELVGELRSLVSSHPLNEWFHGQLIEVLNRCGRRGEALVAYQSLRNVLNEELGLEPSSELQRLQNAVLTAG